MIKDASYKDIKYRLQHASKLNPLQTVETAIDALAHIRKLEAALDEIARYSHDLDAISRANAALGRIGVDKNQARLPLKARG